MNQLLDKKSIESLEPITSEESKCIKISPKMTMHTNLNYDQHSSEEELEVINGPCSIAAVESVGNFLRTSASSLTSDRESSSLEPEELLGGQSPDNFTSTKFEIRKRSLAHSSDDELRNLVDSVPTPVLNFRTSPPLEALKPNRNRQMYRSTTPLILTETSRGIENIKLSCDNSDDHSNNTKPTQTNITNLCDNHSTLTKLKEESSHSHYIHQPQPKYNFYHYKSSATASTSALDLDVRSISPPAKRLFHCAISPRRRPMRTHHAPQRLQRPHRPCLDFDKMQQVSLSPLQ